MTDSSSGAVPVIAFYEKNGLSWGAADLFVLGGPGILTRVGAHAAMLRALGDGNGPAAKRVIVVLPPCGLRDDATEQVKAGFLEALGRLLGREVEAVAAERAFAGVEIVTQSTMATSGLIDLIRSAEPRSAIVVAHAGRMRGTVKAPEAPEPRLPEDTWVPHLHDLANRAVAASRHSKSYVAIEVGEYAPARPENARTLLSVDGCGVVTGTREGRSILAEAEFGARLSVLAADGELSAALAMLANENDIPASARALIRLQLMATAGGIAQVRAELEPAGSILADLSGEMALQAATLALEAGTDAFAARMLARAIPALLTCETLEAALTLADRLGERALVDAAEEALRRPFPDADLLRFREIRVNLRNRQFAAVADLLDASADPASVRQAAFWRSLAVHSAGGRVPSRDDIKAMLADWPDDRTGEANRAYALMLEDSGQRAEALGVLLQGPTGTSVADRSLLWAALDMAERALLSVEGPADDGVLGATVAAVAWLATHPSDGHVRLRLLGLLEPRFLGKGLLDTVAAMILSDASGVDGAELPKRELWGDPCTPRALHELTRRGLAWLGGEEAVVLGRTVMPRDVLADVPAEQAVRGYVLDLEQLGERLRDAADAQAVETILALTAAIAPLGARPDDALVVLRLAAGRLALFGQQQRARDLAEHALKLAGDSPPRARLAWFAFADIYARSGNAVEALVGLACASAAGGPTSWEQVCYERLLAHQIFRNMGVVELAGRMMDSARRAMAKAGLEDRNGHRIELAELHLRLLAADREGGAARHVIDPLIEAATRNLGLVLDQDEDPAPASVFLASLVRRALDLDAGAQHPAAIASIDRARPRLAAGALARIDAFGPGEVTADQIVAFARLLETPRYAGDTAYDVNHLVIGARRLLGSQGAEVDPAVATLAIEILGDQAVNRPGGATVGANVLYLDRHGPAEAAKRLARDGLDLVLLGLGPKGLTRVTWAEGQAAAIAVETTETFSPARLKEWQATYPYAYRDADMPDQFYAATRGLGVMDLPMRAVLIAGTNLQSLPPNLLQVQGDFAGNNRRLAVAPSLTWLNSVRQAPPGGDGRIAAWIPDDVPPEGWPILSTVAHTLRDDFRRHGVAIGNDARPPAALAGASLVVVVAHGGLGKGKRYFHSVSDDVGAASAGATLAEALRDAGTVVLFVCSGGRLDEHPGANTTVGLARQLLDRGCRAVIAPSWPVAARVAVDWLPTFLAKWASGEAAIDACFAANSAVRAASGFDPGRYLAMAVYGDPLARRHRV